MNTRFRNPIAQHAHDREDFVISEMLAEETLFDALARLERLIEEFAKNCNWDTIVDTRIAEKNLTNLSEQQHVGLLDYYFFGIKYFAIRIPEVPDTLRRAQFATKLIHSLLNLLSYQKDLRIYPHLANTAAILQGYALKFAIGAYENDNFEEAEVTLREAVYPAWKLPPGTMLEFSRLKVGLLSGSFITRQGTEMHPKHLKSLLVDLAQLSADQLTEDPRRNAAAETFEVLTHSLLADQPMERIIELLDPIFSAPPTPTPTVV